MAASTGKRKRPSTGKTVGLAAGAKLKRNKLVHHDSRWSWVGESARAEQDITLEHCIEACGLAPHAPYFHPFCPNKYIVEKPRLGKSATTKQNAAANNGEEVIVVSEDEKPKCSKRDCKANPNCLNYLGQEFWESAGPCMLSFRSAIES